MAVVYVTNQSSSLDYTPLAKYGTVVFITRGTHHPSDQDLVRAVVTALAQSKSNDYVAVSGWHLESAISLLAWAAIHPIVPLLVWYNGGWHLYPLNAKDFRKFFEEARDLLGRPNGS